MKKILLYISLAIVFFAITGFAYAYNKFKQNPSISIPPLTEITAIADIVKPYIDNEMTKGLSIGIYKDGEIEFYNYGICSDKNPVLPTENAIYEIGSITKTFTGAILAEMVVEGKVNYNDPVTKYLPKEVVNWSPELAITLEDLATHNSSLPRMPSNFIKRAIFNMSNPYKNYTVEDMYDFLKDFEPLPKSERKSDYSNLGMGLLGHILANVDGLSYEEMVRKRIFQPLGMDDSCIEIAEGKLIQGHDGSGSATSQWDLPTFAGAGAIRSTTTDMMKYLVANIDEVAPYGITHEAKRNYSRSRKIGLAWIIQTKNDLDITWHNGGTGGFRTYTGFSKDKKVGVIVMANSIQSVDAIGTRILQLLAKS